MGSRRENLVADLVLDDHVAEENRTLLHRRVDVPAVPEPLVLPVQQRGRKMAALHQPPSGDEGLQPIGLERVVVIEAGDELA